jgi:hypothetical protein
MTPARSTAVAEKRESIADTHPVIVKLESLIEELGLDSRSAALSIAQSILDTDDIEALLEGETDSEILNGDDYIGEPFTLLGIHGVGKSRYEDSPLPYFLILDVKLMGTDGEQLMTTGSTNVVATAIKLREAGALPRVLKIIQTSQPTGAGYYPQWLRKVTDEDLAKVKKRGTGSHKLDDGSSF